MDKYAQSEIDALRREREKLLEHLAQLSSLSLLISGSFFERFSTCSRPNCACHKGKLHGPRFYVAVTPEKKHKQKQYYVPKPQLEAVRRGVEQYQRLRAIIVRITAINLKLMRAGALAQAHEA